MGEHVCRPTFAKLFGAAWWPRLNRLWEAIANGGSSCPLDMRSTECRPRSLNAPVTAEIHTYIRGLYDSVAETLPDEACDGRYGMDTTCDVDDVHVKFNTDSTATTQDEVRKMPPGSIFELWRQYKEVRI